MRELTLFPRMGDSNIRHIESIINESLSIEFASFLKQNAGLSHYERIYIDHEQTEWEVKKYLTYVEMFKLTNEFIVEYKRKLLPFAFDLGGWHFCLSFDPDTYGKIIINRWTDHSPEDQFVVIADSFEEFIKGLQRNPDDA